MYSVGGTGVVSAVKQQTVPPSIPIVELFNEGQYPEGEICEYPLDKDE